MSVDESWIEGRIVENKSWTERLHSLFVAAPYPEFRAGQFARLALPIENGERIVRSYSLVNPPGRMPLEFYFITVPAGEFTPRLAALRPDDALLLAPRPQGVFTLASVPEGDLLWCLSTGTGIGPFLSMLATAEPWQRFRKVILVHAVREAKELSFRHLIDRTMGERGAQFAYVPVVSREEHAGALRGRIPRLIAEGVLEERIGDALEPAGSQVMLCGNPDMLRDTGAALEGRGLRRNKRREPGNITVESYW